MIAGTEPRPYAFANIEGRWQEEWARARIFDAEPAADRPNWVVIELPPFANGSLHLGHVRNYVLADASARFRRMAGYNVLYTSGFDSFGLPNELAAIEHGQHPRALAERVMADMREEFVRLGLSHDRRRIIGYHEPAYYRWVQWVFLRLFERGLAYQSRSPGHWCPTCRLMLADSLVVNDARCWRCGSAVDVRVVDQWLVRETTFAEDALRGLDDLPRWPEAVKQIHRTWIGRREGVEITLAILDCTAPPLTVFVSQPGLLPALAMVLVAPDHPLVDGLRASGALTAGVDEALRAADARPGARGDATLAATLDDAAVVTLGVHAAHPLTGAPIPIAACAGLDLRSFDGATALFPAHVRADAVLCARAGVPAPAAVAAVPSAGIEAELERRGCARRAVRYRLRDWNIARQRYWGPPVPIVHCDACGLVPVPDEDLPVRLPEDVDLTAGGNPLDRVAAFVHTECPKCHGPARRDTDTLEAYSSPWWYHWNCKSTHREDPFDKEEARRYMPVDLMIGGIDQARTCFFHLRIVARALRLAGVVADVEPVDGLVAIGMITRDGRKMSKSEGNVVRPAEVIGRYGVDALRLAVLEGAAPENDLNWSEERARSASKFLQRVWALCARHPDAATDDRPVDGALDRQLATAVARVTRALAHCQVHLAARNLRLLLDRLEQHERRAALRRPGAAAPAGLPAHALRIFVSLLAPMCPHIAEELWASLGGTGLLATAGWPLVPVPRYYERD